MSQKQAEDAAGGGKGGDDEVRDANDASDDAVAPAASPPEEAAGAAKGQGNETELPTVMLRFNADPTLAERIKAPELEALFAEIEEALEHFTIPFHELVEDYGYTPERVEKDANAQERFLWSIKQFDEQLAEKRGDNGALVLYFRQSICTPKNLEAMLTIMDPDNRTDRVRSMIFWLLQHLTCQSSCSIWNEKLSNGLRFATNYLFQLAKSLERRADDDDEIINLGGKGRFTIGFTMKLCLDFSKDAPIEVLNQMCSLDWAAIFYSQRADYVLYVEITTLFYDRSNYDMLKPEFTAMFESLGSCFDVLLRVLKSILQLRSLNESSSADDIFNSIVCMYRLDDFWPLFYATMSGPPPQEIERELDVLFNCAHATLIDARPHLVRYWQLNPGNEDKLKGLTIGTYDEYITVTHASVWCEMKALTVPERERLRKDLSSKSRESRKEIRNVNKLYLQQEIQTVPTDGNDLCVNCFKTPHDLGLVGERFQRCSLCKQVTYCSRSCQREHWKRVHSSNCAGKTGQKI